jgi:hypothetical protein
MDIGKAIAIVGIWFAVVAALFATANSSFQALVGIIGFLCATVATFMIAATPGDDTSEEKTDDEA